MAKLSDLVTLPFFRDLNDDEIHRFLHATGTIFKRYAKGDRILRAYEDNPSIGVLLDGTGQVLTEDRFGNESASHILERGAILGSSSAILGAPGIASVVALSDTHVLWVTWRADHGGHAARPHPRHRDEKPARGVLPQEPSHDAADRGAVAENAP